MRPSIAAVSVIGVRLLIGLATIGLVIGQGITVAQAFKGLSYQPKAERKI